MTKFDLFATVPKGLESLLLKELKASGAGKIRKIRAGVSYTGDLATAYRSCLWSRLASRVLLKLQSMTIAGEEDLYRLCNDFPWEEHFSVDQTFAIDVTLVAAPLNHSHYAALRIKDAIVDRFRDRTGERPSVDVRNPDVRFNFHLRKQEGSLALDLSGDSLHRRGYRQDAGEAPLKENLAAALLLQADWPEIAAAGGAFCDPMCGSGTLPIEAALIAADIAPGLLRNYFGFIGWKQHQPDLWATLVAEAEQRRDAGCQRLPRIVGYDADGKVVRHALANVAAAGLEKIVHIEKRALETREEYFPEGKQGLLLVNPPYGERLGERKRLRGLYTRLGERLQSDFGGWQAAVLTSDQQLAYAIGLRPEKSETVYNGAIECQLLHYLVPADGAKVLPASDKETSASAESASTAGAEMFANRLRKNLKRLGKWARKNGISCYRLYDADMPEYAVAVDLYGDWVHLQEYAPPASIDEEAARRRLDDIIEVLPDVLSVRRERVIVKVRQRQKGSSQYRRQGQEGEFLEVGEGRARLLVNLTDYLDTGLFLDHRPVRRMIGEMVEGQRFLNLFAYTGAASVHAALGGASETTSVDMSNTYLDWARRNLELNGFSADAHRTIQADCTEWLGQAEGEYDLVFIDPPTFSNSKRMDDTFEIQRDHGALLQAALKLLANNGTIIFSTNFRRFKFDVDAFPQLEVRDISAQTIPEDFQRNPKIHYCFLLKRPGAT
ncbi:MAG: bifunctional 23S rRNA (guanine(2069)-N(7))-methyltransferase RlmK/23S rRNA (guanine(2445)-N(2))-methyltransferase RlmL [Desulfuromonas sp.]|nr:MAG: bifunctional 23S rRNA (guanine(2069)-N(7))-methyltransferase RlmK/23S rRNA (guanine(2445)-N(2))-methyltransferase RlmL [Desulfuromonas sp.]